MKTTALAIATTVLGLTLATALPAQEAGEEDSSSSMSHSAELDVIRDAHRAAMQKQMQEIQQIEDPEERQRRMEELRTAMDAMRDAMRSAHHPECVAGESCGHGSGTGSSESQRRERRTDRQHQP